MNALTKPISKRQRPKPYRCTRPDWGVRIGWGVIAASAAYLGLQIIPALITGG